MAAACELFNRSGIRAVGVDAIMSEAGVARGTFYRYFPSKDDLVLAFLERSDVEWLSWLTKAVTSSSDTPHDRMLAVFSVLPAWFTSPTFRGLPFTNVAVELADSSQRAAELARTHSAQVHAFLAGLAERAGCADPHGVACQLQVLLNGAVVTAQLEPDVAARRAVADHAGAVARALLAR